MLSSLRKRLFSSDANPSTHRPPTEAPAGPSTLTGPAGDPAVQAPAADDLGLINTPLAADHEDISLAVGLAGPGEGGGQGEGEGSPAVDGGDDYSAVFNRGNAPVPCYKIEGVARDSIPQEQRQAVVASVRTLLEARRGRGAAAAEGQAGRSVVAVDIRTGCVIVSYGCFVPVPLMNRDSGTDEGRRRYERRAAAGLTWEEAAACLPAGARELARRPDAGASGNEPGSPEASSMSFAPEGPVVSPDASGAATVRLRVSGDAGQASPASSAWKLQAWLGAEAEPLDAALVSESWEEASGASIESFVTLRIRLGDGRVSPSLCPLASRLTVQLAPKVGPGPAASQALSALLLSPQAAAELAALPAGAAAGAAGDLLSMIEILESEEACCPAGPHGSVPVLTQCASSLKNYAAACGAAALSGTATHLLSRARRLELQAQAQPYQVPARTPAPASLSLPPWLSPSLGLAFPDPSLETQYRQEAFRAANKRHMGLEVIRRLFILLGAGLGVMTWPGGSPWGAMALTMLAEGILSYGARWSAARAPRRLAWAWMQVVSAAQAVFGPLTLAPLLVPPLCVHASGKPSSPYYWLIVSFQQMLLLPLSTNSPLAALGACLVCATIFQNIFTGAPACATLGHASFFSPLQRVSAALAAGGLAGLALGYNLDSWRRRRFLSGAARRGAERQREKDA